MNASKSSTPFGPNLWTSEQSRRGVGWPSRAIRSAPLRDPDHRLAALAEDALDLLVELVAVGDDQNPRLRQVLQDPPGEHHHHDALAAALGVPDDPAPVGAHVPLGRLHRRVLVRPRQLLDAPVEQHEVAHQLEEPRLLAELEQVLVELVARVLGLVLLPGLEHLLGRADRPVAQPLGVVPREDDLDRAEEPLVELPRLVRDQLPDPVADAHRAALQLDHRDGEPVDVEHEVRPPLVLSPERHLLGEGEVVRLGIVPVDQPDLVGVLRGGRLHVHPVAQQAVDGLVVVVEAAGGVVGLAAESIEHAADLRGRVAPLLEPRPQKALFDLPVLPIGPVPEEPVAQPVPEERDDPLLGDPLGLADRVHGDERRARRTRPLCVSRYLCRLLFGACDRVISKRPALIAACR